MSHVPATILSSHAQLSFLMPSSHCNYLLFIPQLVYFEEYSLIENIHDGMLKLKTKLLKMYNVQKVQGN